jgi:hypothetical protein
MEKVAGSMRALTAEQRRLVHENLGLVGVHMRRFVKPIAVPRRDCEWEDLFQEGCMGLIKAAVSFREERGIPFAAYALPRIHNAVSRAIQTKFNTVAMPAVYSRRVPEEKDSARVSTRSTCADKTEQSSAPSRPPEGAVMQKRWASEAESAVEASLDGPSQRGPTPKRRAPSGAESDGRCSDDGDGKSTSRKGPWSAARGQSQRASERHGEGPSERPASSTRPRPTVGSLSEAAEARLADRSRQDPDRAETKRHDGSERETVGERLRDKYERAVGRAGERLSLGASSRGDRNKLVRILTEQRFLVPQDEDRTALRQIARETKSSYARVAQCDKQLGEGVKAELEADPEFRVLRRRAKSEMDGTDSVIDDELDRNLGAAAASEFLDRLAKAAPDDRGRMILHLLDTAQRDLDRIVWHELPRLSPMAREKLLRESNAPVKERGRRRATLAAPRATGPLAGER